MCVPAPSATVVSRSKSYRLRGTERFARREARGRLRFRAVREGMGLIASNARFGPIPLRCGLGGLRGTSPRSQGSLNEEELSRCALGMGLIASNARRGLIPLRCGFGWAPRGQALPGGGAEKDQRSSRRMAS